MGARGATERVLRAPSRQNNGNSMRHHRVHVPEPGAVAQELDDAARRQIRTISQKAKKTVGTSHLCAGVSIVARRVGVGAVFRNASRTAAASDLGLLTLVL
jgi:hypothetical protein